MCKLSTCRLDIADASAHVARLALASAVRGSHLHSWLIPGRSRSRVLLLPQPLHTDFAAVRVHVRVQ